jgi:hypothetical protein
MFSLMNTRWIQKGTGRWSASMNGPYGLQVFTQWSNGVVWREVAGSEPNGRCWPLNTDF